MWKKLQLVAVLTNKERNNYQVVQNQSYQWAYTEPYEYEHLTLMTSEGTMGNGEGVKRFELYLTSGEEIKDQILISELDALSFKK